MRIGLLGGTFDPPHLGHLWLAETARAQLRLDRVLFLPVGRPPHKEGKPLSPIAHRLTMTQLAIADNPTFVLDTTDTRRAPPHTTVSLLPLLHHAFPQALMWLLIGTDSLADLPQWHQPQQLLSLCRLAALPRPGIVVHWATLKTAIPGLETAVDWLDGPTLTISSTELRRWSRKGHTLRYLVPAAVADYIDQTRLYSPVNSP